MRQHQHIELPDGSALCGARGDMTASDGGRIPCTACADLVALERTNRELEASMRRAELWAFITDQTDQPPRKA